MKDSVTKDADYEDIEEELDEATRLLSTVYEKDPPEIAERTKRHLKYVDFHVSYMAEGGANVIFKIKINGAKRIPLLPGLTRQKMQALHGMLLRVRKEVGMHGRSTCEMMKEYEERIKPLFHPRYLLQQKVIRLPRNITVLLEKMLVGAEEQGIRPSKRRGDSLMPQTDPTNSTTEELSTEDHGILIQDLSPQVSTEHFLEFKPKWLMLSRGAPAAFKRCRTCALREMRRADGILPGRGDSRFCPLDFLSNKSYILRPALRKLWTIDKLEDEVLDTSSFDIGQDVAPKSNNVDTFAISGKSRGDIFETEFRRKVQPLLGRLKALQALHRHAEMHDFDCGSDQDVSLAMALRDCSVFLKVEATPKHVEILDVKLADLDLKGTNRSKREKWMEMERRLVEEGWYEGKVAPGIVKDKITCWVSRSCT